MVRREFSWTTSEEVAIVAATHVCCAENSSFRLSALEKSHIQRNGRPCSYGKNGQVQRVSRQIRVFCYADREDYQDIILAGNKWLGRNPKTFWHIAEIKSRHGAFGTICYRYRQPQIRDPYWSGLPSFYDLQRVNRDGTVKLVAA